MHGRMVAEINGHLSLPLPNLFFKLFFEPKPAPLASNRAINYKAMFYLTNIHASATAPNADLPSAGIVCGCTTGCCARWPEGGSGGGVVKVTSDEKFSNRPGFHSADEPAS